MKENTVPLKNKTYVYINLYVESADLTVDQLKQGLGLEPTQVHHKEEFIVEEPVPIKRSFHSLVFNISRKIHNTTAWDVGQKLQAIIEELLLKIESVQQQFDAIRPQIKTSIYCNVSSTKGDPQYLNLPIQLVKRLAALDISLRLDFGEMTNKDLLENDTDEI